MNKKFLIFSTIFCLFPMFVHARKHDYKISGTVFLENKPKSGITVYLYDKDGWMNPDDLLGQAITDRDGKFAIVGSETEYETPEPYLYMRTALWRVTVWLEQETVEQAVTIQLDESKVLKEATVNGHPAKSEVEFFFLKWLSAIH